MTGINFTDPKAAGQFRSPERVLMRAAVKGDAPGTLAALGAGADLLSMSGLSMGSALMMVAKSDSVECVGALLKVSDFSATDQERRTVIDWARMSENPIIAPMIEAFQEAQEIKKVYPRGSWSQ